MHLTKKNVKTWVFYIFCFLLPGGGLLAFIEYNAIDIYLILLGIGFTLSMSAFLIKDAASSQKIAALSFVVGFFASMTAMVIYIGWYFSYRY